MPDSHEEVSKKMALEAEFAKRYARELVEQLDSNVERVRNLLGQATVVVLDVCEISIDAANRVMEQANELLPDDRLPIVESWELNACRTGEDVRELLSRDVLSHDPDFFNTVLRIENFDVRNLLRTEFPDIAVVACRPEPG